MGTLTKENKPKVIILVLVVILVGSYLRDCDKWAKQRKIDDAVLYHVYEIRDRNAETYQDETIRENVEMIERLIDR